MGYPKFYVCIRGKVVSGRADFGLWIEQLSSFYEQKTGMRLYPGTLNAELPSPYSLPRDVIRLAGVTAKPGSELGADPLNPFE